MSLYKLLTSDDVKKIAGNNTIVITYDKLRKLNSIDQLFSNGIKNVIILYRKSRNVGHWIGLMKRKNLIEYFDSYGYEIDKPLTWNEFKDNAKELGQDYPILSHLLYNYLNENNKNKVVYNEYKYQGLDSRDSATCGRHVALRMRMNNLPLEYYQKLFNKLKRDKIDPDRFVVFITNKYI